MLFLPREEGQGLVEYALILVLVAIVVIAILLLLGPVIGNVFSNIIVMEACMDFLAQISPSNPSLGALLYELYEEDVIHSYNS